MHDPIYFKPKVLIVDDDPVNIKILGQALKNLYEIFVAVNGESAIRIAREKIPDLILLDIVLPGLNGYETLKELKSAADTERIPVIFITSLDSEPDEAKGLELGAVDYITKPFSLPIVKARVKTHIELKRNRDTLEHQALYDGLTGVFTRRRFDELLNSEWNRCLRHSLPISLLLIDIDHFKFYNDNYGHPAGDQCLKKVAQALSAALKRSSDFFARYGGEEFAAVLAGSDRVEAENMARLMLSLVTAEEIPHAFSPTSERVTVSMGVVTTAPSNTHTPDDLIKQADLLLYQAKSEGRNRHKTAMLAEQDSVSALKATNATAAT